MQLGFVIDQEACIGCHACTVACKAENGVPVGNFRTSVKYVDIGKFPDIKRSFLVQRCNHCTDAPCVTICPVNALKKRPDGIVDIDREACIGCRACMQACPYDSIYLNEDLGAVEKCHFCAHRVDNGMEPACVTVCPVGAIIPGDFDDPQSPVSQFIASKTTKARREEQGTGPNVRYFGAADAALRPGSPVRPKSYIWSERPNRKPEEWPESLPVEDAVVSLDTEHKVEWGWQVAAYLVTKSLAAGAAMFAPFAGALGLAGFAHDYLPEIVALFFTAVTMLLLVEDLAKPMKFYRMLTRPNWDSWLVKGSVVLGGFSAALVGAIVFRLFGNDAIADGFRISSAVISLLVAGYTAFLFAQCKGRDLWESKLLLPHLVAISIMCGASMYLVLSPTEKWLRLAFAIAVVMHLFFAHQETRNNHSTENARQASAFLKTIEFGGQNAYYLGLSLCLLAIPIVAALPNFVILPTAVGLYLYEHAYVRAGQLPPLS